MNTCTINPFFTVSLAPESKVCRATALNVGTFVAFACRHRRECERPSSTRSLGGIEHFSARVASSIAGARARW